MMEGLLLLPLKISHPALFATGFFLQTREKKMREESAENAAGYWMLQEKWGFIKMINKKALRIILILVAMPIGIPSLFHYAFYNSWLGVIGWGIGLFLLTIASRLGKEEMEAKLRKMSRAKQKLNDYLKIVLWIILGINLIISIILLFYKGNIKGFVFTLEITIFILLSILGSLGEKGKIN